MPVTFKPVETFGHVLKGTKSPFGERGERERHDCFSSPPAAPLLFKSSLSEMTENGSLQILPSLRRKAKCDGPTSICLRPEVRSDRKAEEEPEVKEEEEEEWWEEDEGPGAAAAAGDDPGGAREEAAAAAAAAAAVAAAVRSLLQLLVAACSLLSLSATARSFSNSCSCAPGSGCTTNCSCCSCCSCLASLAPLGPPPPPPPPPEGARGVPPAAPEAPPCGVGGALIGRRGRGGGRGMVDEVDRSRSRSVRRWRRSMLWWRWMKKNSERSPRTFGQRSFGRDSSSSVLGKNFSSKDDDDVDFAVFSLFSSCWANSGRCDRSWARY